MPWQKVWGAVASSGKFGVLMENNTIRHPTYCTKYVQYTTGEVVSEDAIIQVSLAGGNSARQTNAASGQEY
jgi:hypothetical protein